MKKIFCIEFPFIGKTRYVEDPAFADGIRSIHPRTQVLWRLGSAIAAAGPDGWPQGKRMMESALEQLSASVPALSARSLLRLQQNSLPGV